MKKIIGLFLCLVGLNWSVSIQAEDLTLLIKALDKHVSCLSEVQQGDITLKNARFKNPKIQTCADLIEKGDNLKPLKLLWADTQADGSINEKFIGEFCLLLFLSYESIIEQLNGVKVTKSSWFAIVLLYAQLSALPLPKLFEALESCWRQYQEILKGYEVDGVYSLEKWAKEFWWVIPTTIAFVAAFFARWQNARVAQ